MKNLKIALLAIFATATLSAQDLKMSDVPTNILENFNKSYANATDVEWELKGLNYNVEFEVNKMDHEIWYTKEGKVVKTEMEIGENDLPSAIATAIRKNYAGYKIDSIEVTEVNNTKTYEVELDKSWNEELKVVFDEKGNVLSSKED